MVLTAEHLESVVARFREPLVRHREALNRLNLHPELFTAMVGDGVSRAAE